MKCHHVQATSTPLARQHFGIESIADGCCLLLIQERKPRKQKSKDDSWRPMSQQELLAEAARTEVWQMRGLGKRPNNNQAFQASCNTYKSVLACPWSISDRVTNAPCCCRAADRKHCLVKAADGHGGGDQAQGCAGKEAVSGSKREVPFVESQRCRARECFQRQWSSLSCRHLCAWSASLLACPCAASRITKHAPLLLLSQTSLRVCNMQYPPLWLRRMRAPQPPPQPRCLVTGQAAQYRDPQSGQPYSSLAAFKRLRPQYGDATPGAPKAHVPPPRLPGQVSAVARGEQSNRSKQVRKQLWVRNQGQPQLLGQLASSMSLSCCVLVGAARTG